MEYEEVSNLQNTTCQQAAEAQEYLCNLPPRIRKLAERASSRKAKLAPVDVTFSWIFNRKLTL